MNRKVFKMTWLRSLALVAAAFTVSLPSNASVIWSLNDFVFADGGTAVGQFTWNESTNQVTDWNIDVLPSLNGSPGNYSNTTGSVSILNSDPRINLNFTEGAWQFRIAVADLDLLDVPQSVLALSSTNPQTGPAGFIECTNCGNVRFGTPGAFLSAKVPEPAPLALLGLGLAIAFGFSFGKRTKA